MSILEYPDLIWLVREEEIMLDNKREPQKSGPTAKLRTIGTEEGGDQVELLKAQVSQLIELVTALTSQATKSPSRNTPAEPIPALTH